MSLALADRRGRGRRDLRVARHAKPPGRGMEIFRPARGAGRCRRGRPIRRNGIVGTLPKGVELFDLSQDQCAGMGRPRISDRRIAM